ncbi:MAG: vWA domain-containing protein [Hominenteromicrobium sp.]|uniref:vWA domain-containing protein n=1 Tax=Hominenteromicrobium sp. TaxID=3073581 RepID=UPI00399F07BD
MKKTKILSLLLCLSLFCALIVPGTRAYADNAPDSGMKISKTATANNDGSYTITLEAFATGSKVITEQKTDIPTDIVLVIDQSGSMKDPIGGYTYTAYRKGSGWNSRNYNNEEYYPLRHNGGSENLWHKLNNNEYIAVSVEQKMVYTAISGWSNRKYYDNQNSLYCLVSGEYKSITVKREGHLFSADEYWYTVDGQQILYTTGDDSIPNFGQYAPLYQSVKKYIYSYTLNGATTVIEESFGDGSSPDTQFYRRDYSSSAGDTRLNALKNAATTFANAVATKAAGEDGDINAPADNVNHRIAVVGFASGQRYNGTNYNYNNTEVFVGSNQYRYGTAAQGQYGNAFQNMNTSTGVGNVSASIEALSADGGTLTNLGLEMGNGIFGANPIAEGEKRNRVVIVFSDGVPGWSGYDSDTANSAITQAGTAKNTYGATVYTIGIFPGADATSAGNQNGNETEKANWFMQRVSSNTQYPQSPSYYLSAADAGTLNSIFQQISNQIETGGAETTLGSETVVKDIISPYFTLPAGTTASGIRIDTYACTGKDGNTYTWSGTSGGPGGATATVDGDQVSVTGFDFSENWCGTETDAQGNSTVRGNKLVISFEVSPKSGFLGGNEVITNASAGIYENGSAQTPVMTFEQPKVNVPIQDVTVTATDKNVYLKGEVTADQLKDGSEISVGDVKLDLSKATDTDKPYGLDPWQTEYVDITVTVKDKDGNVISDKLENLTEDTTYTVEVTVAPKTVGTSTPANGDAATAKTGANDPAANIYVFKPELTFKDSSAYYGESVPTNNDYSSNKVGLETWKHGDTASTDAGVTMLGTKPTLDISYTPDESKLESGKYTKQDVPVAATVKIGTENVNEHTTFVHQDCTTACGWETPATPGAPAFLIHIQTCTLNITKQGGAADESYVFDVFKDGVKYSEVTVWGNGTETLVELPIGTYTISENTGWSWRYSANNGGSAALTAQNPTGSIACTNTKNNNQWLNGFSEVVRNIFGTNH